MNIQIRNGLAIGDGYRPFIIAEIGSNWRTFDDCIKSIRAAAEAGADAAKFQAFNFEALFGLEQIDALSKSPGYIMQWAEAQRVTLQNQIKQATLPLDWLPRLKQAADASGAEFMCTAFSPELYDQVDKYVSIHKVASAESTHLRILQKLRSLTKPVILSTGAHGRDDVGMALKALEGVETVLMYCVAAYPAQEIDLRVIMALREEFGRLSGYSDHSTDVLEIPAAAVQKYGACVVEKHFTAIPDVATPDRPHSLTPDQFSRMVKAIRGALPRPVIAYSPAERGMLLRHNRRLIATRDIPCGEILLEPENFGIYRSLSEDTHAWHPFMADQVSGKTAKRDIKAGEGIGPSDC